MRSPFSDILPVLYLSVHQQSIIGDGLFEDMQAGRDACESIRCGYMAPSKFKLEDTRRPGTLGNEVLRLTGGPWIHNIHASTCCE